MALVRTVRTIQISGALVICGGLTLGCGSSFESVYESDIRFEHCYRLDLDEEIAPSHRLHCWQGWLDSYVFGQPRDRIEYARRRVQTLRSGDTARPTLNLDATGAQQTAGGPGTAPNTAPAPTSPHAPPPAVVEDPDARRPPPPTPKPEPGEIKDPGQERSCLVRCYRDLEECRDRCVQDDPQVHCKTCDADFLGCNQRCIG